MTLQDIVAKLADCPASEVVPGFSLERPGLQGSMRKSVLVASIRRHLDVECMEAARATTFAELEDLLRRAGAPGQDSRPAGPERALARDVGRSVIQAALRCGIDIETCDMFPATDDYAGHEFYKGAFTPDEIAYCARQSHPRTHFAARWCAKESLKKCDPGFLMEKMSAIEVVRDDAGSLSLRHHAPGGTRSLPHAVSVTHTDTMAAAVVVGGYAAWVIRYWPAALAAVLLASGLALWLTARH
ncbi:MAG: 4'-phosphopantetheinyl transferase superfamily protein [Elusimicrobia bacterium]|nr:4'-phosphopantetheinyl transferase superfamily protein [Elusimicrobiota bacterium]